MKSLDVEVNAEQPMAVSKSKTSRSCGTQPIKVGSIQIGTGDFAVIAGPCSIESSSQFGITAREVKEQGAVLLRGGIWKMRTSPQAFQGLGPAAFQFIRKVINETGLGLVTEVTDPRQVELLDDLVVAYQVGARNMFNYPLLNELGQTRKPVLLKRSFSALVDEWIKAAGYIEKGGNSNIMLCERGIRTFETSSRFTFDLNSVLIAKTRTPYPVMVDPSHAIGIREFVPKLALAAAAVGADGLIVEVHPEPAEALSDANQALTFADFRQMMTQLERLLISQDRKLLEISTPTQPQTLTAPTMQ